MHVLDLRPALRAEGVTAADLLLGQLHDVLLDDVADLLEVRDDEDESGLALGLLWRQLLSPELDEELLDVLLQPIDDIVARDHRSHESLVVPLEHDDRI